MIDRSVSASKFHGLWALTNRELKKVYKEPFILFMALIQPAVWMALFGKAMNLSAAFSNTGINIPQNLPPQVQEYLNQVMSQLSSQMMLRTFGTSDYFSFMSVGILSMVVIFTCMFSGMSFVWDRRLGFLNKVLSTPVSRGVIIVSKMLSSIIRALAQALIVLIIALILGLRFGADFHPVKLLGVFIALLLVSAGLSSIFITIAIRSTRWETHMAVMNLLNLPLLFASNALFPISMMPGWLQVIARINPVTYATDATRQLLLFPIDAQQLSIDFIYLLIFAVFFTVLGLILSYKYITK